MTLSELAKRLASDYAGQGLAEGKAVSVHLFGIQWAEHLHNVSLPELCAEAGIPETYKSEIAKGRNLAKYVEIKK